MKKLIVLALLMVGVTSFAQERKPRKDRSEMEQLSPEQKNELQLKKMTLDLNLNEKQQKEMSAIIAETNAKREAQKANFMAMKEKGEKPTADERYAMKSSMLDEQIMVKQKVQKILDSKQFDKWEQLQQEKADKMKAYMKRRAPHTQE